MIEEEIEDTLTLVYGTNDETVEEHKYLIKRGKHEFKQWDEFMVETDFSNCRFAQSPPIEVFDES